MKLSGEGALSDIQEKSLVDLGGNLEGIEEFKGMFSGLFVTYCK